ncbi:MAG: hypothetical protein KA795_03410 [Burkholderiaceae bacterium]|nr:hypothetical protein [Burkholderiaceae bacterium]
MSELKIYGSRPSVTTQNTEAVPGGHKPQAPQLAALAASTSGTPLAGLPAATTATAAVPPGTPDGLQSLMYEGLASNLHIAEQLQTLMHPRLRQQFEDASARHSAAAGLGGHADFGYPARPSP